MSAARPYTRENLALNFRRAGLASRTIRQYVGTLDRLDSWLQANRRKPLSAATITDVIDYALTTPDTYPTRNAIRSAWSAYQKHHLHRRPRDIDRIPQPRRTPMECRALEPEQIHHMLGIAQERFEPHQYAAVALAYYAGLRIENIASLRWERIEAGELRFQQKGNRRHILPIHARLADALDQLGPQESGYLFPGRFADTHIHQNQIRLWIRDIGFAAGLGKVLPHALRHSFGAAILDSTGDLRATGEALGHSMNSLAVTAGYTRTKKAKLKACIDVL